MLNSSAGMRDTGTNFTHSGAVSSAGAPFNSRVQREAAFAPASFHPGPGTYQAGLTTNAFKQQFVDRKEIEGLEKSAGGAHLDLTADVYGDPCYTVKEGGTLKRKLQQYAASKTERGAALVPKAAGAAGPGHYDIVDGFDIIKRRADGQSKASKFTAGQRLAKMGIIRGSLQQESGSDMVAVNARMN